jgi:hypothetical protein
MAFGYLFVACDACDTEWTMWRREVVMKRYALPILFCALTASAAFAQSKSPVEGVWKIAELEFPSRNPAEKGSTVTNPQPGLLIFTRGYYSQVLEMGAQPRAVVAPAKDPQHLTDAEKIARYEQWRLFGASSGTYEIKGSTLIKRAIVAKSIQVMTRGTPTIWEFKQEGPDTLWLIPTGDLSATEPRIRLTRLE